MTFFPFGETVSWLQRVVTTHPDRNDSVSWTSSDIDGVAVHPGTANRGLLQGGGNHETAQGQDLLTFDLALSMSTDYVVAGTDRFVVRGLTYEVDGVPLVFRNVFTGREHQQVRLQRVTG